MNYLITAAGRGSRFLKSGIKPPKPLIKVLGNELLIWSLNSFDFKDQDKVFIVTLKHHKVKKILESKIKNIYSNIKINWLELDDFLEGQLLTTIKSISHFNIDGPITIHNCDTFHKFQFKEINQLLEQEIFGIIPCFKANGNHWSFAKNSENNPYDAIEVREKERISDNCSVGTYIFSSARRLVNITDEYLKENNNELKEYFIAPIFQYAIQKKLIVKISKTKYVKIFGTPQELLNSFGISFNELLGENSWSGNQTKTLIVDIDKTICEKQESEDYESAKPIKNVCEALRKADSKGVYIILFTSRNMRSFKGSLGLINKITAPCLIKWLSDNEIPYDEIYFGKPWGNSVKYIDDKSLSIDDFKIKFSE